MATESKLEDLDAWLEGHDDRVKDQGDELPHTKAR
jgi:hypothetical protein